MTTAGPSVGTAAVSQGAAVFGAAAPEFVLPDVPQPAAAARRHRRGTGGRWLIWVLRPVLWAILLVIGYQGVTSIAESYFGRAGLSGRSHGQSAGGFPVALAQAYAVEFGQIYLNFNPAAATRRAAALAAFLPPGSDPEFGWNGLGAEAAQAVQVARVDVLSPHRAVVTLLARVNGQLIELGVPIYAARGQLVVSGQPALLPPPATGTPPASAVAQQDRAAQAALTPRLAAFFRSYAAGNEARMRGFLDRGVRLRSLGGAVVFGGLVRVTVPAAGGASRAVTVTVTWRVPGRSASKAVHGRAVAAPTAPAQIEMTYAMTVVRRGGTWYVQSLGAAAQPWAAP